ncbi:MAG: DUF6134 family protein, partial [Alphaproteobacteria bacterium]
MKKQLKGMAALALIGVVGLTSPAWAVYQPKDGEKQKFDITLNDGKVGVYHVDFSVPQDGAILAKTSFALKIAAMGRTMADIRAVGNELVWQNRFVEMQGVGQNAEEKYDLTMKTAKDGTMNITQSTEQITAPAGTVPFSLWNKGTLDATHIYDPVQKKSTQINPKKIRTESIRVLGESKKCVKYKLKNPEG